MRKLAVRTEYFVEFTLMHEIMDIANLCGLQIRDLVFRLNHSLQDVEQLSQEQASALLRGERIDCRDSIHVPEVIVPVTPLFTDAKQILLDTIASDVQYTCESI